MSDSRACRILTIASSVANARNAIQRIKALSNDPSDIPEEGLIPWTITNRYYTASVQFETLSLEDWAPYRAEGVPAVLFLFSPGEPYRESVRLVAKALEEDEHEPEVSLAIRIGSGSGSGSGDGEEGVDEFFMNLGFEYVDGNKETSCLDSDNETDDPGLPRVIDALSTIMWPSMVQTPTTQNRKSRAKDLLEWARQEEAEDGLRPLVAESDHEEDGDGEEEKKARRKSRMQKEMEELERWLEEDSWTHAVDSETVRSSPTWPSREIGHRRGEGGEHGFDDDFTVFVSAPAPAPERRLEPPSLGAEADKLVPMHTGHSYVSLASVSDLGGEHEHEHEHEGRPSPGFSGRDEDDLPSQSEIELTSRRIWGSPHPHPHDSDAPTPHGYFIPPSSPLFSLPLPSEDEEDDQGDEYEMSAFDLSRVFSALQTMKAEIAGMEDGEERRRAAARVALGLVYGLEADSVDSGARGE